MIDLPGYEGWTRGPSFSPDNTPWATVSGENAGVARFSIGPARQAPLVVTAKAQPLPHHVLVIAPNVPLPTDIGIRREMLVFAPLLGDPWQCTGTHPRCPAFRPIPKPLRSPSAVQGQHVNPRDDGRPLFHPHSLQILGWADFPGVRQRRRWLGLYGRLRKTPLERRS